MKKKTPKQMDNVYFLKITFSFPNFSPKHFGTGGSKKQQIN